jgi:D-glycero-D-manno-heptose 1,7-bisphosphate phosphatase
MRGQALANSYIILDRDGTLIKHVPYLADANLVELLPNVIMGLKYLNSLNFKFGIISNQSAIGRGLATKKQVENVNQRVLQLLESENLHISFVLYCPHAPSEFCICRKPSIGLGNLAILKYDIDISSSYMIGDANSDIVFGQAIGLHTIQITELPFRTSLAEYATIDLLSSAKYIHSQIRKG